CQTIGSIAWASLSSCGQSAARRRATSGSLRELDVRCSCSSFSSPFSSAPSPARV
ncbi:MAG: hypothetical protein AVDCRST_MAG68-3364, partial [uncultured Gemmatimonadetes bacterium]